MSRVFAHSLLLTAIIGIQVIILASGYGFLGTVLYYGYLYPPERVSNIWKNNPNDLTMVITLIATVLSAATSFLFTLSVKEALRHRISARSISLIKLRVGVALSTGTTIWRFEYIGLTTLTLFVSGVLGLLTAGWTNILTPNYIQMPISMQGYEIDITGTVFATLLLQEYQQQGFTDIRDNAFEVLDIGGIISGISAAGYTYGLPGIFNFNGAKYNASTQGIVPTIKDYSASGVPGPNGTRLGFSGGNVTVNTREILGKRTSMPIPQGFSRNYSMLQQGLTANVSCKPIDSSDTQYALNMNSRVVYSNATASNDTITGLRLWNIVGTCGASTSKMQNYVTVVDTSGNLTQSSGFLPSVVCPGPTTMTQTSVNLSQTPTSFKILSKGFYKYDFLNASVCEVTPLLTMVRGDYSNDLICSEVISSTPFRPENVLLLSFIAGVAKFQSTSSQGLMSSTIGDTLYSIYSSSTTTTIGDNLENQTQVYNELEEYWRGVVEFSATFLRSGFMAEGSFPNDTIPVDLQSPVNGTMYISTIGWTAQSATFLLVIIPSTIITVLTVACSVYSILQNKVHSRFDPSNTLHLIMVSTTKDLQLRGFSSEGIIVNEGVEVRLEEVLENNKGIVANEGVEVTSEVLEDNEDMKFNFDDFLLSKYVIEVATLLVELIKYAPLDHAFEKLNLQNVCGGCG
ncbi:hypothetical protein BDR04DRAFT_1145421 [Suillus decipiens]|nr:hypothetical protein BDR04DRAFT_1145421 [Suillus decipiens]